MAVERLRRKKREPSFGQKREKRDSRTCEKVTHLVLTNVRGGQFFRRKSIAIAGGTKRKKKRRGDLSQEKSKKILVLRKIKPAPRH